MYGITLWDWPACAQRGSHVTSDAMMNGFQLLLLLWLLLPLFTLSIPALARRKSQTVGGVN